MTIIETLFENDQINYYKTICKHALFIEREMAELGASFLSKEGLIFCNAVINNDQNLKRITYSERCSLRAANLAVEKFLSVGLLTKRPSSLDKRSVLITVNYNLLNAASFSAVPQDVNELHVLPLAMAS